MISKRVFKEKPTEIGSPELRAWEYFENRFPRRAIIRLEKTIIDYEKLNWRCQMIKTCGYTSVINKTGLPEDWS